MMTNIIPNPLREQASYWRCTLRPDHDPHLQKGQESYARAEVYCRGGDAAQHGQPQGNPNDQERAKKSIDQKNDL